MNKRHQWIWILLLILSPIVSLASLGDGLKVLPVQDAGRIKPFDTFARESLQLIHGKQKFAKRPATDVVFTWMFIPEHWRNEKDLIEVRHSGLRDALKLEKARLYYSPQELMSNERLGLLLQELKSLRERREKLNPYYQAVQTLENQLSLFHAITMGQSLRLLPDSKSTTWVSVADLQGEARERFAAIIQAFTKGAELAKSGTKEERANATREVKEKVQEFIAYGKAQFPDTYETDARVRTESFYNDFHPFRWAWVFYLLSAAFLMAAITSKKDKWMKWSWIFTFVGFALHTFGFAVRVYLVGRPPVSNMYETVVWVAWGATVFAMILEAKFKIRLTLLAANIISILCLILSDLAPTVLDASLHPLEPVLRSQFWLMTHVLIIVISYAAFFLAFVLGDIVLFYYLKDEKKYADDIKAGCLSIYRCLQIGVVLLAPGIILGGVWADYSWGRFWGWDPKETWALIALLGYLAILHARLVGWIKSFGLAACSVAGFSLVIMAWYGVNFVLGAGLHTYGFGAGGVEWVSGFVAAHLIFVAYSVATRYQAQKQSTTLPK